MTKTLSFAEAKKARTKEVITYVMDVLPEDLGLSRAALGLGANESVSIEYRPYTREEWNDILEAIKGEKGAEWVDERDFEILMRCLVHPAIPSDAEGRKFIEGWTPGAVQNISEQVQQASGYRRNYTVQRAADALKNSETTPPTTTSN